MQHAGRNFLFYLKDSSFSSFHLCSRPPLLIPRLLLAHGILVRWFCHPTDPHSFLCQISKMVRPKLAYPTMWGTPAMFVSFKIQLTTVTSLISPQWTQTFTLSYVRQLGYHPPSAINPIKKNTSTCFSWLNHHFPMVFRWFFTIQNSHRSTKNHRFFRRQLGTSSASQGGRECVLADWLVSCLEKVGSKQPTSGL